MLLIKPSLNLVTRASEHASNGVPAIMNFTRASSATRINAAGLVELMPVNSLRHDYAPTAVEYKGWLLEEASTNLLRWSEDFTSWTLSGASATMADTSGPAGALSAGTATYVSGLARISQAITATPSTTYTLSMWAKVNTATHCELGCTSSGGGDATTGGFSILEGASQTVAFQAGESAGYTTKVEATYPDGWTRFSITFTTSSTHNSVTVFFEPSCDSAGAVQAGIVYYYGMQLEDGVAVTSYIPTTTTTVTRSADVADLAIADFPFNIYEGTLYVEIEYDVLPGGSQQIIQVDDGTGDDRLILFSTGAASVRVGGVIEAAPTAGIIPTAGNVWKCAFRFKENDVGISANGSAVVTDVSSAIPQGLTTFRINSWHAGTSAANLRVKHVATFPTGLTDAELQEITL